MDWILCCLAAFGLVSLYLSLQPRNVKRKAIPWSVFGVSLLTTELAWLWLPLQILLSLLLVAGGALDSVIGKLSLLVLLLSWCGLAWHIWQSRAAAEVLEDALCEGLGKHYRERLDARRVAQLRQQVGFADWKLPFRMTRPGVEVIRDIPYGPLGMRQHLDIYRPQQRRGNCPVLLQIHGGAWTMSRKEDQGQPLMWHLAARGWICVAVNYRLSPSVGFPTHLEDCKRALCWIRENGADYGMDTDFIAVTGGSAGGHLAALVALTANRPELQADNPQTDTAVQAAVPLYGIYDFVSRFQQYRYPEPLKKFLIGRVMYEDESANPELWDLASPVTLVNAEAPPFFVLHGTQDSLIPVRDAQLFVEKLRAVSQQAVVYAELPYAEHGFELFHSQRAELTVDAIHRFLEWSYAKHLQQSPGVAGEELAQATGGG
ncbi:alpha/beta hydrolase fold domain-containing protein [Haliea sp. E17]|uniref:alpha/beta hydrolase fold domain-containing protein n=1 Tax=Haliea sp. E17 TaxID=3401576 RepID=UPI003AAB9343